MQSQDHARRETEGTKTRILDAASALFAERGYRGATVATICHAARANIAAVNYYFGSKEGLYQQAWRHAHGRALAQFPPHGGVAPDRPAAERLRGIIRAGLQRAIMGDAIEWRIVRNEMASPTGLLRQVIDDTIRPIRQMIQQVLRELLGPHATGLEVELCEICVVAPLMHVTHHRQAANHEGLAPIFTESMMEDVTDHFAAFALAGIRDVRRRLGPKTGARAPAPDRRRRRTVRET